MTWESQVLALLAASLVRPFALVAAAWAVLHVFRVRHPASRHAVWTAVLLGMLLLPPVSVVAPHWKVPVLAPRPTVPAAAPAAAVPPVEILAETADAVVLSVHPVSRFRWPSTDTILVWFYFAGLIASAAYRIVGWVLLRRVVARSKPVRAHVLESEDVLAPVAIGVLRPVVILPASWRAWSSSTRRAVLAHEFAHLRRRDVLVLALARFARCVFWFHPLAWWLSQKVSDLAELACDTVVVSRAGDPTGYSRILLAFAEAVSAAGQRTALPGLAMATKSGLRHRIDELFALSAAAPRELARPLVVLAAVGLPVLCLAAATGLGERRAPAPPRPQPIPAPATAPVIQLAEEPAPPPAPKPKPAPKPPQQAKPTVAVPAPEPSPEPQPKPKFEVASVKACKDQQSAPGVGARGGRGGGGTQSPDRLEMPCLPARFYVQLAYVITQAKRGDYPPILEGAPDWLDSERYRISAKADSPVGRDILNGPMLQSLLEERFQLKTHRETREAPSYDLVLAKGGLKLRAADDNSCSASKDQVPMSPLNCSIIKRHAEGSCIEWDRAGSPPRPEDGRSACGLLRVMGRKSQIVIELLGASMNDIAHSLANSGRPVYDRSGIEGTFDFHAEFQPDGADSSDNIDVPSVFAAMGKLGLKLESSKMPRNYVVIDHIERPSEN
jgi:uncharacterized protein (TIGR03435 family)